MNRTRTRLALIAAVVFLASAARAADEAPLDLALTDLDGAPISLAKLRGQVVVIDVWATWCVPCERALPHLDALARDLADRGLVVLAVSQDEETEKVKPFLAKLGVEHLRVALDPKHQVPERLQPTAMPTTYVLDPLGGVAATFDGYHAGDETKLRVAVEKVLPPVKAPVAPAP